MDFVVSPVDDSGEDAAAWWASEDPYLSDVAWSKRIASEVAAFQPSSVLEFGANAGRNLAAVRELLPTCELVGIDINEKAVAAGRERWDLDLRVGDQSMIHEFSVDVAFTVSVLDHLPDPQEALEDLLACASKAVILWEPWLGEEGKVARNFNERRGQWIDTTPYSYSWDYGSRLSHLPVTLESEEAPIDSNLGRWYRLYRITPDTDAL
jgi:SAM-dependent methyltransferase